MILVKEPSGKFYNTKRHIISYTEYAIAQCKPDAESEFFTFTGDFFNLKPNNKELKPLVFSDDNNNFYKDQNQVIETLNGISSRESSLNRLKETLDEYKKENTPSNKCFLIPIIVTNANISVVDYTMDEVLVEPHKWVLQKAKINDLISLENQNGESPYTISIPVVNIAFLAQFVKYIERMVVVEGEINVGKSLIDENH